MTASPHDEMRDLREALSRFIIGQQHMVDRLLIGLLANGNLLVEGLPGLAKTRAIKGLAKHLDADLSRIQFTPDLLPSDVTGTEVYHQADEINRAPAKVQAALLEAMEERQVTVAGTTHVLPRLFLVMATQNPIEQEGTYPLPEAQMDRFLMKVLIEYPGTESEKEILALVRRETATKDATAGAAVQETVRISQDTVFAARREIEAVQSSDAIDDYIVALIEATRYPERVSEELASWIQVGASPRGSLALDRCSRTHAWLEGRDHVLPDDVRAIVHDCLRHRLILSYEAEAEGVTPDQVVSAAVESVAVA